MGCVSKPDLQWFELAHDFHWETHRNYYKPQITHNLRRSQYYEQN